MGAEKYKNAEGYADPTAGEAISAAMKDYYRKKRKSGKTRKNRKIEKRKDLSK